MHGVRTARYELLGKLASGGMGEVHLARMQGPLGFHRLVAVKTMHPRHASDPAACAMFLDEAQLTAHLRHPNIVPTLDFVAERGELMLVMDYVEGDTLRALQKASRVAGVRIPPAIACAIARDALRGLHAAHEACDDMGRPLGIVHRDMSPDNVIVGLDGVTRVLDFGVAHARSAAHVDASGAIRGKLVYMAPEHLAGEHVDRRVDVYSVGALLWEALVGHRLYRGADDATLTNVILSGREPPPPSASVPGIPPALDAVVLRMLAHDPRRRPRTALEAARELEAAMEPASPSEVGRWAARFARPRPTPPPPSSRRRASGRVEEWSTLTGLARPVFTTRSTVRTREQRPGVFPALVLLAVLALGGASALGLGMRASGQATATATQRCSR